MAEDIASKIKLVRCKLGEFIKIKSDFANLDKHLKDSEVYLNLQLTEISEEFKKVKSLNDEILSLGDEYEETYKKYVDENIFHSVQGIFFKFSTNLHELIKIVNASDKCDITYSEFSQAAFQKSNFGQSHYTDFNFAMLNANLASFDGSYDKWPDFKESFQTNVHENHNLNSGAKLKILQSLLKGDAQKIIKREFGSVKSSDYEAVWLKLNKRYNHKRALVNSLFSILFYQPSIERETAESIKRLYDTTFDTLLDLRKLELQTESWGDILLFLIHSKLPLKTKELWDEKLARSDSLPKFNRFMDFLEMRFRTLESIEVTRKAQSGSLKTQPKKVSTFQNVKGPQKSQSKSNSSNQKVKHKCRVCTGGAHSLRICSKFLEQEPSERLDTIKSLGYCINCFSFSHKVTECKSEGRCSSCGLKHHSLLHFPSANRSTGTDSIENNLSCDMQNEPIPSTSDGRFNNRVDTFLCESETNVIFPTALVRATNSDGHSVILRAIIDSCSDVSYISKDASKRLNLPLASSLIQTNGVGDIPTTQCTSITSFRLESLIDNNFSTIVSAYVLPKISSNRPARNFKLNYPANNSIRFADPSYNIRANIDLLLGGAIDASIKLPGFKKSDFDNIYFQETLLGWVVSGSIPSSNCFLTTSKTNIALRSLDFNIRQFWELEEIPTTRFFTKEEEVTEIIYSKTTTRLPSGKYSVCLPFKRKVEPFQDMRKIALKRFSFLERKLSRNQDLRVEYNKCLNEYIELGHMYEIDPQLFPDSYYIPHHSVIKESSTTTRLRVVFDASAKDTNLRSLNDYLLNGPRLQSDLLDVLVRFRFFKIGFTADIAKMYRQILINPSDHKFQLIVWRDDCNKPLKTYAMKTVTFGTTSAPYLAVKTLYRLADDEEVTYPLGAKCLRDGFYVDDCIYGADTIDEALEVQAQVLGILRSAGFHLRKWSSNAPPLLESIPEADRETNTIFDFDSKLSVKTLGLQWYPVSDNFIFKIAEPNQGKITKRSVLSEISKIFDPMGLFSPCIISAKLLIQNLWQENKGWDEELSTEHSSTWLNLREALSKLNTISIPRWLGTTNESKVEIHGFADASPKAYAAVIYVRSTSKINGNNVNLLFSKTKVAPLKTISLPRLELMGALMLAKMMDHLKRNSCFSKSKYVYWSDSEITLAWIRDDPHKRAVFVANRITEIQTISNPSDWRYINTLHNPADLGTRGICPSLLSSLPLWWHGPGFLLQTEYQYNHHPNDNVQLPLSENVKCKSNGSNPILHTFLNERRNSLVEVSANLMKFSVEMFNKFSTLPKLVRVVSYCMRFLKKNRRDHTYISPSEYDNSLMIIVKMVQMEAFHEEISNLENGKEIPKHSSIYSLHPVVCESNNILRVCGRLANAEHLNMDQKFPIILPRGHVFSLLIVRDAHLHTCHGTQQETTMLIAQRYHIIRCKHLVRYVVNRCVKCFRHTCKSQQQFMGLLPKYRVSPNRPFQNCGVDLAGPFDIKKFKGKCSQSYKSYFAVFVCFSTKAVHIEVVIDLSSAAFIAAYRRFIARRGLARNVHSDCGTNFVGAEKTVTRKMSEVIRQWNEEIAKELSEFHTTWHFNPPGAPHFGGLWEAGVKSIKHHLKRVIGDAKLTYDEFETILCQVEAILNSRPLVPISDETDRLVLTPAHFLVQDTMLSLPDNNLENEKISLIDRWCFLQKLLQRFWKLWSEDYLNTLRQRKKWKKHFSNVKVGDVVIVRENNLPPSTWLLGLVTEVHPGPDGLVRVVTVKTKNRLSKRPICKISPLPI